MDTEQRLQRLERQTSAIAASLAFFIAIVRGWMAKKNPNHPDLARLDGQVTALKSIRPPKQAD
ncbi:MAG: hypothetical protein AAF215_31485 [Cyanobacteria bacterium P01_A01_bin.123]